MSRHVPADLVPAIDLSVFHVATPLDTAMPDAAPLIETHFVRRGQLVQSSLKTNGSARPRRQEPDDDLPDLRISR